MTKSFVTGRLAPSPTGAQHLGNARTYLLAWLSARHQNGNVVLRIEDIDSPRIKPWAIGQAIDDLRWLGLDWDAGPFIQTERTDRYDAALQTLIDDNRVYPCTCTRTDIDAAASAPHESIDGPIYPGTCSHWQLGDNLPPHGTYCWRFRTADEAITIGDLVRGDITVSPRQQLGDFAITRKSLEAAYQLAVVVDDEAMGVTEVVRGDDLVASAFRQVELQRALGLGSVVYAHVPLVVGTDGRRLAKRHGDTRLSEYRDRGVTPQQIIGWAAASAGLIEHAEPITPQELVQSFDWKTLIRSALTFTGAEF